jgi:hypothetical protein
MSTKDLLPTNSQGSSSKFIIKKAEDSARRVSLCVKSNTKNLEQSPRRVSLLPKPNIAVTLINNSVENPLQTFERKLTARRITPKASVKCSLRDFDDSESALSNRTIAKSKWQATGMNFFTVIEDNIKAIAQQKKDYPNTLAVPVWYHGKKYTLPIPETIVWPTDNNGGVMKKKSESFSASIIDLKSGVMSDLFNLDSRLRTLPANPKAKDLKDSENRGGGD